jgi:hypothetical protein
VVDTDGGGQLELMTDDVRVTSGNTPHEARASRGVTADTGFDDATLMSVTRKRRSRTWRRNSTTRATTRRLT